MSKGLDFKLYYDTVIQAAARTRNSIYLLVAVLVTLFSVYFNTQMLSWAAARMQTMVKAYDCIQTHPKIPTDEADACKRYLEWAGRMDLPTRYPAGDAEAKKRVVAFYQDQVNTLARKRADLRTFQIPIIGSIIDLEDLGLLSGSSLLILLLIVRSNMRREYDTFVAAREKAERIRDEGDTATYAEARKLLSMVQVLGSSQKDNLVFRWVVLLVLACAPWLHGAIHLHNMQNPQNVVLFFGQEAEDNLMLAERLLWYPLIWLAVINAINWVKLVYVVNEDAPAALWWTRWRPRLQTQPPLLEAASEDAGRPAEPQPDREQ